MHADIDRVLFMMHVIGSVIDAENFVFVHSVADKHDPIMFSVRKCMLITIIQYGIMSKQMVLKAWNKVLIFISYGSEL
jgi:hypothetical protein